MGEFILSVIAQACMLLLIDGLLQLFGRKGLRIDQWFEREED